MKRATLLLTMILRLAAAAAGQEVLTLDKAVATALEQNQMLRGAAHDVESSHWGKQTAYTNFLPRVSLDAGVTRIDPETELRANAALEFIRAAAGTFGIPSSALVNLKPFAYRDTYSAGITVVQPVYNGGAEIVGVRAADALQEKSDYGYQDTEQDVIARVRMSYYGVLAAQELVALAGLALTKTTLNMFSLIGIIMLMGLVTKNAILLVDFTNTLRSRGHAMRDALLEAGKVRLRPIVMTTATMVFGMMPLALALGAGSEMRQGMAVVVIGGLISSTLLTLVLVPVVYTYVDGIKAKVPVLFKRVVWAARLPWKERPAAVHADLGTQA